MLIRAHRMPIVNNSTVSLFFLPFKTRAGSNFTVHARVRFIRGGFILGALIIEVTICGCLWA